MLRLKVPVGLINDTDIETKEFQLNPETDAWYVTHMADGKDKLTFTIDVNDDNYKYIIEEAIVKTYDNEYLIKNIDEHSDIVTVNCVVNVDDWKSKLFHEYKHTAQSISAYVGEILPTGWSAQYIGTFQEQYAIGYNDDETENPILDATSLDILDKICDLFECAPFFDVSNKLIVLTLKSAVGYSGVFYSDEVNLKSLGFVGNSTDYVTRVYCYGAKDKETGKYLTMSSVNAGKDYVENTDYTDKIINHSITDTSITDPNALYNKALDYLLAHSKPTRSYALQVSEVKDIELFSTCTVIDSRNNKREEHMVIQYKEYPDASYLDTVVLDELEPDVSRLFKKLQSSKKTNDELDSEVNDVNNKVNELENRVEELEQGSGGGGGSGVGNGKIGGTDNTYGIIEQYDNNNEKKSTWDNTGLNLACNFNFIDPNGNGGKVFIDPQTGCLTISPGSTVGYDLRLSDSVTEIPSKFFLSSNLRSIVANGVTKIGANAFADCKLLERMEIGGPVEIGDYFIGGAENLNEIVFHKGVSKCSYLAFSSTGSYHVGKVVIDETENFDTYGGFTIIRFKDKEIFDVKGGGTVNRCDSWAPLNLDILIIRSEKMTKIGTGWTTSSHLVVADAIYVMDNLVNDYKNDDDWNLVCTNILPLSQYNDNESEETTNE